MGILSRGNPLATPRSVIRHALGWAMASLLAYLSASVLWNPLREASWRGWLLLLLAVLVFGGGLGGLIEWQIDDGLEDEEPATHPTVKPQTQGGLPDASRR